MIPCHSRVNTGVIDQIKMMVLFYLVAQHSSSRHRREPPLSRSSWFCEGVGQRTHGSGVEAIEI